MFVDAWCTLDFDAALEREALEQVAEGLAPLFDIGLAPHDRAALLVASDNAGSGTSVQFWADAQRTGVALASPELFPWCLANAPCGALARRFQITGPNLTLLGEADALVAALDSAADLFDARRIDLAFVLALSFVAGPTPGRALALRLKGGAPPGPWPADAAAMLAQVSSLRDAIDILATRLGPRIDAA